MSATLLFLAFAIGHGQPVKAVTDAEKKEFFKVLTKLPRRGEFFTAEGIQQASPYTRVLLALTEKDVPDEGLYPFLALSRGLIDSPKPREYGIKNFDKIAHPTIKLFWASVLFKESPPSHQITDFLRKALDNEKDARILASMSGPAWEDLKEKIVRAADAKKRMKLERVKEHEIDAFPKLGGGQAYRDRDYVFTPDGHIHAVRPHTEQKSCELITYDIGNGKTSRRLIPNPPESKEGFANQKLMLNDRGDLFCLWMIGGNGNHGIALLKKGATDFQVKHVKKYWMGSRVVAGSDGNWYVIQDDIGFYVVHRIDIDLKITEIGKIRCRRNASCYDARFITKDTLHLFTLSWEGSHAGLRLVDYDLRANRVLHNREFIRGDKDAWSRGGAFLQLQDGTLHYLWSLEHPRAVDDIKSKKRDYRGEIYYQAETSLDTIKVSDGSYFQAISARDRIIVCYTDERAPDKVYLRVIGHGALGPTTEMTVAKGSKHNLWSEYMVLAAVDDRIWFVNTLTPNTLHELKLVDTK